MATPCKSTQRPYRSLWSVLLLLLLLTIPEVCSAVSVVVNGQTLPSSPPAVMLSGRTLLPMRMVFEALGAQVGWDNATQTAIGTRGDVVVRMTINSRNAYINDRLVVLDVPAQLIGGHSGRFSLGLRLKARARCRPTSTAA